MRLRWLTVLALAALAIALICAYDRTVLHFLGWDGQTSDNYAAWSGSVPALFTLVGMSTLITGLWHGLNCRMNGCMRIGHYKDSRGIKWCWRHHPDHKGERPSASLLHQLHFDHLERLRGGGGDDRNLYSRCCSRVAHRQLPGS
jgi:hypothetical protein